MRKLYIAAVSVALLGFVGCQKDVVLDEGNDQTNVEYINFTASDDLMTRTTLGDDGLSVNWITAGEMTGYPGDKIMVYKTKPGGGYDKGVYTATSRNGSGVLFTGGGLTWDESETSATFSAIYIGGEDPTYNSWVLMGLSIDDPILLPLWPGGLTGRNNFEANDRREGMTSYMVAPPVTVLKATWNAENGVAFNFKHLMSLLQLNVAARQEGTWIKNMHVGSSVTRTAIPWPTPVPWPGYGYNGEAFIDLTSPDPKIIYQSPGTDAVTFGFDSPIQIPVADDLTDPTNALTFYIPVLPGNHGKPSGGGLSIDFGISGLDDLYYVYKGDEQGPEFKAGKKKTTTVILDPDMSTVADRLFVREITGTGIVPAASPTYTNNYAWKAVDSYLTQFVALTQEQSAAIEVGLTPGLLEKLQFTYIKSGETYEMPHSYEIAFESNGTWGESRTIDDLDIVVSENDRNNQQYHDIVLDPAVPNVTGIRITIKKDGVKECRLGEIRFNGHENPGYFLIVSEDEVVASSASGSQFTVKAGLFLNEAPKVTSLPSWVSEYDVTKGSGDESCYWNFTFTTNEANTTGVERTGEIVFETALQKATATVKQAN